MLYRVYVDEAGDRGISRGSGRYFVVSAIVVREANDAQLRSELAELRDSLGRHPGHVLHFVKFSHAQRLKATQDVATFAIEAIANVIIDKALLSQPLPAGDMAYISSPDPMYLWALRLLLERISWLVDDNGGTGAAVTFAHLKRFRSKKLHDYRHALEASDGVDIRWKIFDGHPFRIAAPKESNSCRLPTRPLRHFSRRLSQIGTGIPSLVTSKNLRPSYTAATKVTWSLTA